MALGRALLAPTRIYVPSVLALHRSGLLKAAAHITGGGLPGNVPRVLPEGVVAEIEAGSWPLPEVFRWLAQAGDVAEEEMLRVFNCGLGMVLVVAQADAAMALTALRTAGEEAHLVGRLVAGEGEARVAMRGRLAL
jgi:phosphoribosylformylglycinamidine cyclo-ligase